MLRPTAVVRGLLDECRAMYAVARRVPGSTWIGSGIVFAVLACVGMLPLGHVALALQLVGWSVLAILLVAPGIYAREWRVDDALGIRGRHDAAVVAHLPDVVALYTFPFYMVSQAVLFWRLERQFPGTIGGDGWSSAWRYAIDNLLLTELFLDVFDVFRLTLAGDAATLLGRTTVFATRAALSLGFIRVAIRILRAATYRAAGVGRGIDHLGEVAFAAEQRDAAGAAHHARAIADGMHGTVDLLIERTERPDARADAWRALHALHDWAIPHLRRRVAYGDPLGPRLDEVADRLAAGDAPPLHTPGQRPLLRLGMALAIVATLASPLLTVGPVGLALSTMLTLLYGWALLSPRARLEAAVARGIVPPFAVERFGGVALMWSAATMVAFLVAALGLVVNAAAVAPGAFEPASITPRSASDLGSGAAAAYVGANVLRVQILFGAADVFDLAPLPLTPRPLEGSVITLAVRTGINVGLVTIVLTLLSLGGDRLGLGALGVNHVLLARLEALRGGRYAHALAGQHDLAVCQRLMVVLDEADDADVRAALAASGAFDWCAHHPTLHALDFLAEHGVANRVRSTAAIVDALVEKGLGGVDGLMHEIDAIVGPDGGASLAQLLPVVSVETWSHRASIATSAGRYDHARRDLDIARDVLEHERIPDHLVEVLGAHEDPGSDPADAAFDVGTPFVWREAGITWARAARSFAIETAHVDREPAATLLRAARDRLTAAAAVEPERLRDDALLCAAYTVVLATGGDPLDELATVVDGIARLSSSHPRRTALGALSAAIADVLKGRGIDLGPALRERIAALDGGETTVRSDGGAPPVPDAALAEELRRIALLALRLEPGPASLRISARALAAVDALGPTDPVERMRATVLTAGAAALVAHGLGHHDDVRAFGRTFRAAVEASPRLPSDEARLAFGTVAFAEARSAATVGDEAEARALARVARDALVGLTASEEHGTAARALLAANEALTEAE